MVNFFTVIFAGVALLLLLAFGLYILVQILAAVGLCLDAFSILVTGKSIDEWSRG